MRLTARTITAAAIATGMLAVGTGAAVAADLGHEDYTITLPGLAAAGLPNLGHETISVHIDNNQLLGPLCITLHVASISLGNIIGPVTACLPVG
jgi:hypothetical protein